MHLFRATLLGVGLVSAAWLVPAALAEQKQSDALSSASDPTLVATWTPAAATGPEDPVVMVADPVVEKKRHAPGIPVVTLNDGNFTEQLAARDEWILDFYATWCGACRMFAPKLDLLGERLADADMTHVGLAKIDIDASPELAAKFMITRLPTLFYVRDNQIRAYEGPLDAYHIFEFIQSGWEQVTAWDGPFSPFSIFGTVIGKIAGAGSHFTNFLAAVPLWGYLGIFASLPVVAYVLIALNRNSAAPSAVRKQKKNA
ncbi:hypothetical protein IWQ60_008653 [Tieghemiomyces parasiticus]|uniref:Thioredoxin domain-containing protein n=1 Tax=Tieghemiomyces parasiticus TaxID=78921 RepID=A0A9W8A0M6_9FUNG|nr:hypothetical protein IWQ60_008653 [Tieghemiomyces parasiticus]